MDRLDATYLAWIDTRKLMTEDANDFFKDAGVLPAVARNLKKALIACLTRLANADATAQRKNNHL